MHGGRVGLRQQRAIDDAALRAAGARAGRKRIEQTRGAAAGGGRIGILRDIDHLSDLSPDATKSRLLEVLSDDEVRSRIRRAAVHEPPRVRAMVGRRGSPGEGLET